MASGVGLVAGPSLGTFFYWLGGYTAPFYFLGVFFLASAVLTFPSLSPNIETSEETKDNVGKNITMISLLKNRRIIFAFFCSMFCILQWSFVDPFLSKFMRDKYGVEEHITGLIFVAMTFGYLIAC